MELLSGTMSEDVPRMGHGFTVKFGKTKVVDLYVHYVRRKLERAGAPGVIETVRGVGYAVGR